jgi:hypothetical protein
MTKWKAAGLRVFTSFSLCIAIGGCGRGQMFDISPEAIRENRSHPNLGTAAFSMPGPMGDATPHSLGDEAPVDRYRPETFDRNGNYLGSNGTDSLVRPKAEQPSPAADLACQNAPSGNAGACRSR